MKVVSFVFLALSSALRCEADAPSAPAWWAAPDRAWIDPLHEDADPNAVATVGQAKWAAYCLVEALGEMLPDLAAAVEAQLVGPGKALPSWAPPAPGSAAARSQRGLLLIGQLKAISAPFYDELHQQVPTWLASQRVMNQTNHAGTHYPWGGVQNPQDWHHSPATIGQLKAVFALRLEHDSQGGVNGLPDIWEEFHFGAAGVDPSADPDNDGLTNLQEFELGTNPTVADSLQDLDDDGIADVREPSLGLDPTLRDHPLLNLEVKDLNH